MEHNPKNETVEFDLNVRYLMRHGVIARHYDKSGNSTPRNSAKVKTNMPKLDEMLNGGLKPGLHCVTGGPSSYKSALLLQVAYLAAADGHRVIYLTDEIARAECIRRLVARKLMVGAMREGGEADVPSWSTLEDIVNSAVDQRDYETVSRYADATRAANATNLRINDMDEPTSCRNMNEDQFTEFLYNTRYIASAMVEAPESDALSDVLDLDIDPRTDLLIIDPVNSLRLFSYKYNSTFGTWICDDYDPEPRKRMEMIVMALDNFSHEHGIVTIGVFHGNRTRGQSQQHPCMGDFKETSAIEYRAVSAMELVRADDMRWSNHPKAPRVPEGFEAVGLFLLKSRTGRRTEQNKPLWLCADGGHNLIMPIG